METQPARHEIGDLWLAKQTARADIRRAIEKAQGILSWQEILSTIADCPHGTPPDETRGAKIRKVE